MTDTRPLAFAPVARCSIVVAFDHDRCIGVLTKKPSLFEGESWVSLSQIVAGAVKQGVCKVYVVSYSGRQSDTANEKHQGQHSHDALREVAEMLRRTLSRMPQVAVHVDTTYFLEEKLKSLDDANLEPKAYKYELDFIIGNKTELAASILQAYPLSEYFLFVDDKYEMLQHLVAREDIRIDCVQFSPLIFPREVQKNTRHF